MALIAEIGLNLYFQSRKTQYMRAPKSFRLHIGIFGRRNAGKSSLLNALTQQDVSIVSEVAGTTTDPVEKPMELLPLGPVLFIDTAGIDDVGALGEKRIAKTLAVFDRTDLGVIVSNFNDWGEYEESLIAEFNEREIPFVVVFNKCDLYEENFEIIGALDGKKIKLVQTSVTENKGLLDLRQLLLNSAPADFINRPSILGDLVGAGEAAVLVVPIDKEAPKGRLILPQVQSIRDLQTTQTGGYRFAGLFKSGCRHTTRYSVNLIFHSVCPPPGRYERNGTRSHGHRQAKNRRQSFNCRSLLAPSHWRRYWHRKNSALVNSICGW
jgi:small GTP-binding protein